MSQRDGFAAGFIAGSLFGGIVGGVLGSMLASRINNNETSEAEDPILNENPPAVKVERSKKRQQIEATSEQRIEMARRSLEEKIAQLNQTIDEARQQLGNVNGTSIPGNSERSLTRDS
jgi:Na+/glutamate symporter